ncbi:hypothetical protein BH23ACT5_BH23ACT5_10260 [soil metagenome]
MILGVLVVVFGALPAQAAQLSASDLVLVDTGTVVTDDLYAAGNRVLILGRVEGDLVVTSFADVVVAGQVSGDVIGVAGEVTVTGTVGGSVRLIASTVTITGSVEGDVVSVAWDQTIGGEIASDVLMLAFQTGLDGVVAGNVTGQSRRLALGGTVEGNVDVTVTRLSVTEGATVGGDLGYRSDRPSSEVDRAEVGGSVTHRTPLPLNVRLRALGVLAKLVLSLMAGVVGLLVMWAVPGAAARAGAAVRRSWWRSWLRGIVLCLAPLVVIGVGAAFLAVTPPEAALPVVGVMFPVFLAVLGALAALGFAAPAAVYPWLGNLRKKEGSPVKAFLLALAMVTIVVQIPWLTWLVVGVVVPIGMGGWVGRAAPESPAPPDA